jgi:hypothetical protein
MTNSRTEVEWRVAAYIAWRRLVETVRAVLADTRTSTPS